jgi:ubiquinol-cytochrome c reductase iron-sulfur subunit
VGANANNHRNVRILGGDAWKGGFYCPCHGSKFDLAGRVYTGVPAPINLMIPPYHFVSNTLIQIGVSPKEHEIGLIER